MINKLTDEISVSPQIAPSDVAALAASGFRSIISNRPDGEGADQPLFAEIEKAARERGLEARYVPVASGKVSDSDTDAFRAALADLPKPVLAYCRTGTRSATLWSLAEAQVRPLTDILARTKAAGYDMSGVANRIRSGGTVVSGAPAARHDIVIVGGGAAGAAVAASLLKRERDLDIAIIEPAETHYYQPGWTLVGAGVFTAAQTARSMASVLPRHVTWIKAAVAAFIPDNNAVVIEGCRTIAYNHLVVCPGIKLNWSGIEGLNETLGKNGVTSNYRYDLAPYTWELVQNLKAGRAIFTQPPMPIKCAGAPQKAMYLSADHWLRSGCLNDIDVSFFNSGAVLFGVPDYVPALMDYVKRYGAELNFNHTLTAIDGPARTAWFTKTAPNGSKTTVKTAFDMIHACPPQMAPDFIRGSALSDAGGWIDVDPSTLRHKKYGNIFGLGDATNTPNAKTAAAARKQAPVVAENLLFDKGLRHAECAYDGYGSCPLTVERGKVVLAEFMYGGKVCASFPNVILDGTKPSRLAWALKERILPPIYWQAMLKGREWMAQPKVMA
ncbi:MAG: TIGR01244 family phosphatase [Hyphomicrobium sp.]|jgi:sulfide:quinone oxidoreductase|uniref:bifunctional protein tyrosine phosphatase family protein/NAD(P)/FAD-dependent oxidoreductase n=1 Tax=Hyphomicrobium sp. TaxID=82 RepID=UPI0025C432D1|nr:bifunctional protein tyrosine phosphatase family protein/NAD(P)/FAD-dependent oxidoreductase [Hyphomicrobium sp.]MBX9862359.1 TIGR01244 family phosphatase [Hyphomicrobium sp.]